MTDNGTYQWESGQLVRIISHVGIGEVARISGRKFITDEGVPVYSVWRWSYARPWSYKECELEAVEVVNSR